MHLSSEERGLATHITLCTFERNQLTYMLYGFDCQLIVSVILTPDTPHTLEEEEFLQVVIYCSQYSVLTAVQNHRGIKPTKNQLNNSLCVRMQKTHKYRIEFF